MFLREENIDTELSNIKDERIWQRLKEGDHAAFVWIYNKYVADLIRYGCQIANNKALVEDVVQDIFVSLWEKKENQADVHSIKFYLLSAIRRTLLRRIKKEQLFISEDLGSDSTFEITPSYLEEKLAEGTKKELTEKIVATIKRLSERQREIIYLKFYQNLSYKEIAALLDLDQKYTYNLASRAYSSFKDKFDLLAFAFLLLFI